MDSREPGNVAFIQFQLHPNYSTTTTGIVGCYGVKFGCNRNMIKYIFLESGNIIDYHSRLDFCRPFYSLPTQASNAPCDIHSSLIVRLTMSDEWIDILILSWLFDGAMWEAQEECSTGKIWLNNCSPPHSEDIAEATMKSALIFLCLLSLALSGKWYTGLG